MLKQIATRSCLVVVLVGGVLMLWTPLSHRRAYVAESLLAVRPLPGALLPAAFEREVKVASPGIARVAIQLSIADTRTSDGIKRETNGIIRLVAAGATAEEAEQLAIAASDKVRTRLNQDYGATASQVDQVRSTPAYKLHEGFKLRVGKPIPGPFPVAGPVYFENMGLSIEPGEGWMRWYTVNTPGSPPIYNPHLIGEKRFNGAFIRAYLSSQCMNLKSKVEELRSRTEGEPGGAKFSYAEEQFKADNGASGLHLNFTRECPPSGQVQAGAVRIWQAHHYYILTNAQSGCAVIDYISVSGRESKEVQK